MLTKKDMVDLIAKQTQSSKAEAARNLEAVMAAMQHAICKKGGFQLVGFGAFSIKKRAARTGRNVRSGEAVEIPAKKHIRFAASLPLKRELNRSGKKVVSAPATI